MNNLMNLNIGVVAESFGSRSHEMYMTNILVKHVMDKKHFRWCDIRSCLKYIKSKEIRRLVWWLVCHDVIETKWYIDHAGRRYFLTHACVIVSYRKGELPLPNGVKLPLAQFRSSVKPYFRLKNPPT